MRNTFTDTPSNWLGSPIYLEAESSGIQVFGNIHFNNCLVYDSRPRPFIRSYKRPLPSGGTSYFDGISGTIAIVNPNAAGRVINLGSGTPDLNVSLAVQGIENLPISTAHVLAEVNGLSEGEQQAAFRVRRTAGNPALPLAVALEWSGAATSSMDYRYRPEFALMLPNADSAYIPIVVREDRLNEGQERLDVRLLERSDLYQIAPTAASARVDLFDLPLLAWRWNYFQSSSNSGNASNTADPDGDGQSNLIEYALGSSPAAADIAAFPIATMNGDRLSMTFPRLRSDVKYNVQASNDLINWTTVATNLVALGQQATFLDNPLPEQRSSRFLRLSIEDGP